MRANFVIITRIYLALNGCEMQHNAEVGLFTRPSRFTVYGQGYLKHGTRSVTVSEF